MRAQASGFFASRPVKAMLTVIGLVAMAPAQAHHPAVQYDFAQDVEITGKIIHLDDRNPHIDLILEYPGGNGAIQSFKLADGRQF